MEPFFKSNKMEPEEEGSKCASESKVLGTIFNALSKLGKTPDEVISAMGSDQPVEALLALRKQFIDSYKKNDGSLLPENLDAALLQLIGIMEERKMKN